MPRWNRMQGPPSTQPHIHGITVGVLGTLLVGTFILCCDHSALCSVEQEKPPSIDKQTVVDRLKDIDSTLEYLEKQIREDSVGWWDIEIITSSRTNRFHKDYLTLRSTLQPTIVAGIQAGREQAASVKTMGQALTSLSDNVPLLMTLGVYKGQLNHIEFMIESRRSVILTRFSVYVAVFFGALAIIPFVDSIFRGERTRRHPEATPVQVPSALGCCLDSAQPPAMRSLKDGTSSAHPHHLQEHLVESEPQEQATHRGTTRDQQEAQRLRNLQDPKHVKKKMRQAKKRAKRRKR